jgi:FkbM family methyltransferase
MRRELLYSPRLLCERLAIDSQRRRRLKKIRGTVANGLKLGHIDSLELLEIAQAMNPRVIFDLGANVGTWSLLAKAISPLAVIHAFEPLECHSSKLELAIAGIPDIKLHRIALGSRDGSRKMNIASFSDASSLLEIGKLTTNKFGIRKVGEAEVSVTTLDSYVERNNLALPDLIKLDLQGYELEALRGAETCLSRATCLICEVSFLPYYNGQPIFHDIVEFLADRGFQLHALGINTPVGRPLGQTDALFVRSTVD